MYGLSIPVFPSHSLRRVALFFTLSFSAVSLCYIGNPFGHLRLVFGSNRFSLSLLAAERVLLWDAAWARALSSLEARSPASKSLSIKSVNARAVGWLLLSATTSAEPCVALAFQIFAGRAHSEQCENKPCALFFDLRTFNRRMCRDFICIGRDLTSVVSTKNMPSLTLRSPFF